MSKFTTPVSMQVTQEQFTYLKTELVKLGYKSNGCLVANLKHVYTNPGEESNSFSTGNGEWCRHQCRRYFIDHYNPTLFLAIAAMSNEKDGIAGEYWICTNEGCDSGFTTNKIYKALNSLDNYEAFTSDRGEANGWYPNNHNHFRKATKEELINHFTKENMKKDTIIGYKLTKPEYEEAIRNLVKSQITNYKKEKDLTLKGNRHSIGLLEKAGVLSLWFTPIYKQQEQVFKVGNFEVKVKDGKVFHLNDDITEFTIGLINHFKPQKFGGYLMQVEDVTFSRTGCQTTSKLSEWLEVFKALNK